MAMVVLGAGASRGASFVGTQVCLPPLNGDFFTQLQRIQDPKHHQTVLSVIGDAVDLFGANFRLTLEDYFTQIEFFLRALEITGESRNLKKAGLQKVRSNLLAGLAAVLEESVYEQECLFHNRLIENLPEDSTILSFNYDCLIDDTLRRLGGPKWNARYGFLFPLRHWNLKGVDYWNPTDMTATRAQSIKLLKLHGSINWQIDTKKKTIKLKQRLHRQHGTPRFTIVPPEWHKEGSDHPVLRKIWGEAARRIHRETVFAFIGFSFVPTDLHVASLFQVGVKDRAIRRLIIANPNSEVRRKTQTLLQRGFSRSTEIIHFASLEEMIRANLHQLLS